MILKIPNISHLLVNIINLTLQNNSLQRMKKSMTESFNTKNRFEIKHEGYISKISENAITVSLKGNINCEGCKAKAACGVSESNDKEIEVFETNQTFNLNESVQIILEKGLGLKAVFFAYVLPFILLIITLFVASNFLKEWVAGLLSLSMLIPYYLLLYFTKDSFQKMFKISILKNY